MLTQRAALVLGAEQRAPLQLGYNMMDEIIEAVRQMCRRHHEAVASALCEQRLELIRYLGCSPGDLRHHDALAITAANLAQCHSRPRSSSSLPRACPAYLVLAGPPAVHRAATARNRSSCGSTWWTARPADARDHCAQRAFPAPHRDCAPRTALRPPGSSRPPRAGPIAAPLA